ncbi:MAG: hypothetical protein ACR2NM_00755, partial [Bythopirellula sp.]
MNHVQLSTRRQLELMQKLQELANQRAEAEANIAETLSRELKAAQANFQGHAARVATDFGMRRRDLENEFADAKRQANDDYQQQTAKLQHGYKEKNSQSKAIYKQTALTIERKKKERDWQVLAVFDAAKDRPQEMLDQAGKRILAKRQQVDGLQRDANTLMSMRRLLTTAEAGESPGEPGVEAAHESATTDPTEEQQQTNLRQLKDAVLSLQNQLLPSVLLEGVRPIGWWLAACVGAGAAGGTLVDWSAWQTPLIGFGVGTVVSVVVYLLVGSKAKQQSLDQFAQIQGQIRQAHELEQAALEEAREQSRLEAEKINQQKHDDLAAAQQSRDAAVAKNEARRAAETEHLQRLLDDGLRAAEQTRDQTLAAVEEKYPPLLDDLATQRQEEERQNLERSEQRKTQVHEAHDKSWNEMAAAWQEGFQTISTELATMREACQQLFPDWSKTEWAEWQRPSVPPAAIQFGSCSLPLSAVKNGISADSRLVPAETNLQMPALMPFDELPRFVVTAARDGCPAAVDSLQAMMLRFLTAMPAGKLRFTIVDP